MGFEQATSDPCLFKKIMNGKKVNIIVYVDNLLISGKVEDVNYIVKSLPEQYEVKDLGEDSYII